MSSLLTEKDEPTRIAIQSMLAGIALAIAKLVGGLLTGSLGLLSEAAHSGLDAFGSLITALSVRASARPPDADHPYGHGRFENLSASIQGLLLLGTGSAIAFESVRRLILPENLVRPSPWAFIIMAASIVVDFQRSRVLSRAAEKYGSRALEADALNFRADLLSSGVVLLGLALTSYSVLSGKGGLLLKADAAAALIVAILIIGMAGRLLIRSAHVLTDRASGALGEKMTEAAAGVPGVLTARPVRMRESGRQVFADVVVTTTRTLSFAQSHQLTERIEQAINLVEPRAEVLVHIEPIASHSETTAEGLRAVALGLGIATHHEQVYEVGGELEGVLHLEVDPNLTLREAHGIAEDLSAALRSHVPGLRRVATHIEAAEPNATQRTNISSERSDLVAGIRQVLGRNSAIRATDEIRLYGSESSDVDAVISCSFAANLLVGEIHLNTEKLEHELREQFPELARLIIHAEPDDA